MKEKKRRKDKGASGKDRGTSVNWGEWDDEEAAAQAARAGRSSNYLKLPIGDTYLRFLPPKRGQKKPIIDTREHFFGGKDSPIPGHDGVVGYSCPELEGEHCAVCERARQLKASRSNEDRKLAGKMFPKLKGYANVIDLEDPDAGPQVLQFGTTILTQLLEIRNNPRKGGNFTHPLTGRAIIITRKGDGMDTEYTVSVDLGEGPTELDNFEWIEDQSDLETQIRLPSPEDEELAMLAVEALTGGGMSRTSLPKGGGRKRTALPSKKSKPVEDDDDDWEDDDEEDEAPPPRRTKAKAAPKRAASKRAQDIIDDDDDDDWEDDDDDWDD